MTVSKYVCNHCVEDEVLSALILEEGEKRQCDYCKRAPKDGVTRSLALRELAEQIHERIVWEYSDVDSEMVSYDSEEEEYWCETYDTGDLLRNQVGLEARTEVIDDVARELPDLTWCKKQLNPSDLADALNMGWTSFVDIVKYQTRYLFSEPAEVGSGDDLFPNPEAFGLSYDPMEGIPPERILEALGAIVERAEILRKVEKGTKFFRARVHALNETPLSAKELGPPPREKAWQSNRMSPAGIVMFYGALDQETAIKETFEPRAADANKKIVTVAEFVSQRSLLLLDLTDLPPTPSFFGDYELHHGIRFLWDFEQELTKPIARDGMEHIEYVPTQVVTEYFRYKFRMKNDARLDGILYRSSRNQKPACVLFLDSSDCGGDTTFSTKIQTLQLLENSIVRIPGSKLIQVDSGGVHELAI
jgi:hypothetical protein